MECPYPGTICPELEATMRKELVARAVEPLWHDDPLLSVAVTEETAERPFDGEMHRAFKLNCVLSGRQNRYSDGHQTVLNPGDVCLVPGWEPHSWQPTVPRTRVLAVLFLPEFLGDATIGGASWLDLFVCPPDQRPRVATDELRQEMLGLSEHLCLGEPTYTWRSGGDGGGGSAHTSVTQVLREMVPGGAGLPPAWEDGVRYDLLRMLVALYQNWKSRNHPDPQSAVRVGDLSAVMPAIRLSMSSSQKLRRFTLAEASRACSLSQTHFRRVFRRAMGTTYARFEVLQRVAAAERLLHASSLTLDVVAERCGFTDGSHLDQLFRSVYGHTAGFHRGAVEPFSGATSRRRRPATP
jgi:AraC-like DNA-binding protein